MPRNTTKTLGATNGGRGGLAGYTELCESIAQFKIDSVRRTCATPRISVGDDGEGDQVVRHSVSRGGRCICGRIILLVWVSICPFKSSERGVVSSPVPHRACTRVLSRYGH